MKWMAVLLVSLVTTTAQADDIKDYHPISSRKASDLR
jgi:hypothetical protein